MSCNKLPVRGTKGRLMRGRDQQLCTRLKPLLMLHYIYVLFYICDAQLHRYIIAWHMYSTPMHACIVYKRYPSDVLYFFVSHCRNMTWMNKLQTEFNHPCIAVIQMDYTFNMFLVVEREIVYNVESVFQAVKVLLVSYYVFNIAYPNLLGGLFVYYVFSVFVFFVYLKTLVQKGDNRQHAEK